jgi:hypothetical protein
MRLLNHRRIGNIKEDVIMANRSEQLAGQYEQAVANIVKAVEGCSDAQWGAICGDEKWTVAATAHHVGSQLPLEMEYISAAAEGRAMPAHTWDDINGRNERHAAEFSACSKADALKVLREGSATMAAYVRGLSDEQLARTGALPLAGGAMVSTEQLITGGVLIEHATAHLASIQAAG